jgi:hypothetical protein
VTASGRGRRKRHKALFVVLVEIEKVICEILGRIKV